MNKMAELLSFLKKEKKTLGSVESMTGGLFASTATSVPGASAVFKGAMVTYSCDVKSALASVDPKLIEEHGVVSVEVAKAMARGGMEKLGADIVISVTGNAGPTAEPGQAGVGQAYFAIATKTKTYAFGHIFNGERNAIREQAVELMCEAIMAVFGQEKDEKFRIRKNS